MGRELWPRSDERTKRERRTYLRRKRSKEALDHWSSQVSGHDHCVESPPPRRTAGSRRRPPRGYKACTWEPPPHLSHGSRVSLTRTTASQRSPRLVSKVLTGLPSEDFRPHPFIAFPDCRHPRRANRQVRFLAVIRGLPPLARRWESHRPISRSCTTHC